MLGFPKFSINDEVSFNIDGTIMRGVIAVVDAFGNFYDNSNVSYDIFADDECLYKHISESAVFSRKLKDFNIKDFTK